MRLPGDNELTARFDDECRPVRELLTRVGDKWSVLVVVTLGARARRFNALRRALDGISQRVLTSTLRALERDGLIDRTVHPTNPPQVEYTLTQLGRSLLGPLTVLANWAHGHAEQMARSRERFDADRDA